jgi:hypothetical protein
LAAYRTLVVVVAAAAAAADVGKLIGEIRGEGREGRRG